MFVSTALFASLFASPAHAGDLQILGDCPGTVNITLSDMTPNGQVAFVYGRDRGTAFVPGGGCAGAELGLDRPKLHSVQTADALGNFSLSPTLPGNACGTLLQIVDLTTCETSPVVPMDFRRGWIQAFPTVDATVYKTGSFYTLGDQQWIWTAGDYVEETISTTNISYLDRLELDISAENTTQGCGAIDMDWEVTVNDIVVGSFTTPPGGPITNVDETFTFAPIPGDGAGRDFTIRWTAQDTICGGGGAYRWQADGTATLVGDVN